MTASELSLHFVVTVFLYLFVSRLWTFVNIRIEYAKRGCRQAPLLPNNDILGLTRFLSLLKARREKQALKWMIKVMDMAGPKIHTARDKMLGHSFIWTRDIENARALFMTQASDFDIDSDSRRIALPMIGSGIFNTTGEVWKESRAFLRPHFTRNQISSLSLEEKHFQAMLTAIQTSEKGWTADFDIQPLILNFTLDVATEFLFGTSANSQNSSMRKTSHSDDFQSNWDGAAKFFEIRAILRRYCWLYQPKKFREHCRAIHTFADKYVDAALARRQLTSQKTESEKTHKFVVLDELVNLTTDRARLRAECLNVLGASRTSTAGLIQWVFYFLARHPSTFDKLRQIILVDFGEYEHVDRITYENLRQCRYLHCCINEVFRIAPVIPIQTRIAVRDTTLPRGGGADGQSSIPIPKGTEIRQVFYAMCMQKELWGEDVTLFRPERFENRTTSSEWLPFGAGPRMCIGRQSLPRAPHIVTVSTLTDGNLESLALTETAYLMVRFLQRFDKMEAIDPHLPTEYDWNVSTRSAKGVKIRLRKATDSKHKHMA